MKPSNTAVNNEWRVYLLDVETAKQLEVGARSCKCGAFTEVYAAPEVLNKNVVTLTSDLYSAGLMIEEALRVGACTPVAVQCVSV